MTLRRLLITSAAAIFFAFPAMASERPILLAQAEGEVVEEVVTDPVLLAEEAVEEARAALRTAMASGRGIAQARQNLREAIRALEAAREAAGLEPGEEAEPSDELPPTPPPTEEPPPPTEEPPPVIEEPPPLEELPPPAEPVLPPVAPEFPSDEPPELLIDQSPPLVIEEPPPLPTLPEPPVLQEVPPPPQLEEVPPPPAEAPPPPPAAVEEPVPLAPAEPPPPEVPQLPTPPAEIPSEPPTPPQPMGEAPPPPEVDLPPPVVFEPPPPPPPAALEGEFSLEKFTERPRFGEEPPAAAAAPPPPLPQAAEAIQEGATVPAPDGRVIVKNQGQVTVIHDDTGRFRQRGDRVRSEETPNDTTTTTVTRPDGTEVVTVRDKWGNIVQRYRKNRNGSVEILIGEAEQPGFVGRIFGQGIQPAPPPPPQPPAPIQLNFGPLVLSIPEQQYIVESSRADQQALQQALVAPPVETVERAYTLEEIRRSGRLRDKLRRIDLDTITFETAKATIPDDQIAQMHAIGMAIRDVILADPTQVILIEGHTDAVGSDIYNLALSDRRAETVAQILSYYFGVPPENLVTQGYGESYLKIPTAAAERQNRRVAFRNITYLLRAGG